MPCARLHRDRPQSGVLRERSRPSPDQANPPAAAWATVRVGRSFAAHVLGCGFLHDGCRPGGGRRPPRLESVVAVNRSPRAPKGWADRLVVTAIYARVKRQGAL